MHETSSGQGEGSLGGWWVEDRFWSPSVGPDFPIHGAFQIDGSVHMDEVPFAGFLTCFLAELEAAMD